MKKKYEILSASQYTYCTFQYSNICVHIYIKHKNTASGVKKVIKLPHTNVYSAFIEPLNVSTSAAVVSLPNELLINGSEVKWPIHLQI